MGYNVTMKEGDFLSYYFLDFDYGLQTKTAHKILMKKGSLLSTGCGITINDESIAGRILDSIPDGVQKCNCCDAVEIPALFNLIYIPENTFISYYGIAGAEDIIRLLQENYNSPDAIKFLADVLEGDYQK
jgi:hypothetical protein